jgi:polar amino acid transport system ATP-binding protein
MAHDGPDRTPQDGDWPESPGATPINATSREEPSRDEPTPTDPSWFEPTSDRTWFVPPDTDGPWGLPDKPHGDWVDSPGATPIGAAARVAPAPAAQAATRAASALDSVPPPAPIPPVLACRDVRKSFRRQTVLAGVDMDIDEHEVVALIGASGSGKSTLLRCVNLLEPLSDGMIFLDGVHITAPRVNADRVRRRIGIVFQAYNLFPHLSVLDNVVLAPVRVHGRRSREAEDEAYELLARVGLADKAKEYPDRLSGGQQQRVAIVRALINSPRLLLLDEVTSALDPELVGEVLDLIRDLKGQGMTMMIATHEMGFARQVADRVCFLDAGRVLESGPPERVLDNPEQPRTQQFLRRITRA